MRRQRLRFDHFLVSVFTCIAGEERVIPQVELSRGRKMIEMASAQSIKLAMSHHDNAKPLHPITIFTKGSFNCFRGDDVAFKIRAGDGGWRFALAESLDNFRLRALEDDSQYHCLFPLDRHPTYWQRQQINMERGDVIPLKASEFIYIATGKARIKDRQLSAPAMIEVTQAADLQAADLTALDAIIGVRMWR